MKARLFVVLVVFTLVSPAVFGQATRTWVSGVGDDANPCSRTAPCKTFQGAISKTATAGEISVLDPAGYGQVTINKSITIDGSGTHGSILSASTNGITINATASSKVILRNIQIDGAGTGLNGINIVANGAGTVILTGVAILNTNVGISATPNAGATRLVIENTDVLGCSSTGISLVPTAPASVSVSMNHVRVLATGSTPSHHGISLASNTFSYLNDVQAESSAGDGFHLAGAGAIATIRGSSFARSGGDGVRLDATASNIRIIIDSSISAQNNGAGFRATGAGTLYTSGTNRSFDNGISDTAATPLPGSAY